VATRLQPITPLSRQIRPILDRLPEQLAATLKAKGYNITMKNAGVYGDTIDGVRRRLHRDVSVGTDIVILWIGANDVRLRREHRDSEARSG